MILYTSAVELAAEIRSLRVLKLLGYNVLSLRSGLNNTDRAKVLSQFNDEESSVDVLAATYSSCALEVNIHRQCR